LNVELQALKDAMRTSAIYNQSPLTGVGGYNRPRPSYMQRINAENAARAAE
jgi:hypothetical protein